VRAAGERVGQQDLVTRLQLAECIQRGRHRGRHGSQMDGDVFGLRDQLAVRSEQRG